MNERHAHRLGSTFASLLGQAFCVASAECLSLGKGTMSWQSASLESRVEKQVSNCKGPQTDRRTTRAHSY
jgi:hypothetical protein